MKTTDLTAAAAARFELVTICADTDAETVIASHWTMAAAMKAMEKAGNSTELRLAGVTLAHKAGSQIAFTAFRPA